MRNLLLPLVAAGLLLPPSIGRAVGSGPIQAQVDVASPGRLKLIELSLLKGWTVQEIERGHVRPHGLAEGSGVYLRADADPKIYPATRQCYWGGYTIHLWLMDPDYAPGRFAKKDIAATATYLGRGDRFRAFYFVDKGTRTPGGSVGGHLAQGLDLNLEKNHRELAYTMESGNLEEKVAVLEELYLFLAYNFENDAHIGNAMRNWGRATLRQAVEDPHPELRRHIKGLYDEAAFLAGLSRIQIRWKDGQEVVEDYLFEAISNRPDLTKALYDHIQERLTEPSGSLADEGRLLRLMSPPPEATLRAALTLRLTEEMEWFTFRAFLEAAIHHLAQSDYWALTYELTHCEYIIMPESKKEMWDFYQRTAPHEAAAVGFFRALLEGRGAFDIRSMRYQMGQRSVEEWIKEGWPGKGQLALFSSFAQSAELKRMILKHLRERENTELELTRRSNPVRVDENWLNSSNYWFLCQLHNVDLLALNFLIRKPIPEALPDLLPLLGVQHHSMANGIGTLPLTSAALYREMMLNPSNETKIYAAQAILNLGRPVSPNALSFLKQRIAEEGKKQVGQGPVQPTSGMVFPALTDIDLACLILGFLADPEVRAEFDLLGKELAQLAAAQGPHSPGEVSLKVWQVADEWFDAGGRKLLLNQADAPGAIPPKKHKPDRG